MNEPQKRFVFANQRRKTFNAGRGCGKSYAIGHWNVRKFQNMPQAKSLLFGNTFYQILTKTAPEMEKAFADWGYREYDPKTGDGVFVFGKKPPAHWKKPHSKIRNYNYCYSFINGYTIELASSESKENIRGSNNDAIDADESATINPDVWKKIVVPTCRGINSGWKNINSILRYSICDFTSAPWTLAGQWIYEVEELAKKHPDRYLFVKAKTRDNVKILGEDYLQMLQETLSPLEYFVEVENGRLKRQADGGFYPAFDEEKHVRTNVFDYEWNENGRMTVTRDNFIHQTKELIISIDFNVKFTSCVVCQEVDFPKYRELRFIDSLFEMPDPGKDMSRESELLVDRLVDKFCRKYAFHQVKYIEIDGDNSAGNMRVGAPPMFDQVLNRFRANGWQPVLKAMGRLPMYQKRYLLINNILRQADPRLPRIAIHGINCQPLVMSIQNAPVKGDFEKDKSSERQAINQVLATHLSDCFDYVIMRKYGALLQGDSQSILLGLVPSGNR
jgi:hypothetical protein